MASSHFKELIETANNVLNVYGQYEPYFSYFDSITNSEMNNVNVVLSDLHFKCKRINENEIPFKDVLSGAMESFKWFSKDVQDIFERVFTIIDFDVNPEAGVSDFVALTTPTVSTNKCVNRYTMRIVTPQIVEKCSKYFLSHEFIHAIKDTYYDEMKLLFTSIETIPILWEFIQSYLDGDDVTMSRVFSERYDQMLHIEILYNESNIFLDSYSKGGINCNQRLVDAVKLVNMESIMYLNSFYYAVCLFERFLRNKKAVLEYLDRVLVGKITTKYFINVCSLLDDENNDEVYAKGLKTFKLIANNNFKK